MYLRFTLAGLLVLALSASGAPVWAQESDEDEESASRGTFIVDVSAWATQPAGLDFFPASQIDRNNPFTTALLRPQTETQPDLYARVGYRFPGDTGTVIATWFSTTVDDLSLSGSQPGNFVYGELVAHPFFAGVNLDGLADTFNSRMSTQLSDFRLDYARNAVNTARVKADWFVGYRRVTAKYSMGAAYDALVPHFPPFLPPLSTSPFDQLTPLPDLGQTDSEYRGRGLTAGMDFLVPLWKDRINLEAGFNLAVLRGKTTANYQSETHYYVLVTAGGDETLLAAPYEEFGQTYPDPVTGLPRPVAENVQQRTLQLGLSTESISTDTDVLETYLGLRGQVLDWLEIIVGWRNIHYNNIGMDLRPKNTTAAAGAVFDDGDLLGVNTQDLDQRSKSATYEGFYLGLGFRY